MKLPERFAAIEAYMNDCMAGSTHDAEHVLRVVHYAADIAYYTKTEPVDAEILITAAMLHDIGRPLQDKDSSIDHAAAGAEMAHQFLLDLGWEGYRAAHVRACILTHRFRSDNPPDSIEAKILFDADKLDVTGAVGVARTLSYGAEQGQHYYNRDEQGRIEDGSRDPKNSRESFFREYNYKLKHIKDLLYTVRAKEIAAAHQPALEGFYRLMLDEIQVCFARGALVLPEILED